MCEIAKFRLHSLIQPAHSGIYDWSQELQGVILSSFYWGYAITHLPGGLLGILLSETDLFTSIFDNSVVINRLPIYI